jgi:hypothetical protein
MSFPEKNFILYGEVYTLYLNIYPLLRRFPKSEKFTLRQSIETNLLDLLLTINQYQNTSKGDKSSLIRKMSYIFDKFKLLLRLSVDLHFFPQKNYAEMFPSFELIGKLIGGLMRKDKFK